MGGRILAVGCGYDVCAGGIRARRAADYPRQAKVFCRWSSVTKSMHAVLRHFFFPTHFLGLLEPSR